MQHTSESKALKSTRGTQYVLARQFGAKYFEHASLSDATYAIVDLSTFAATESKDSTPLTLSNAV